MIILKIKIMIMLKFNVNVNILFLNINILFYFLCGVSKLRGLNAYILRLMLIYSRPSSNTILGV